MSLKGGDMNTYLTRMLVACVCLCSFGLSSFTWQDLMDPSYQPYQDKKITMEERLALIERLKAEESSVDVLADPVKEAELEAQKVALNAAIKAEKDAAEAAKANNLPDSNLMTLEEMKANDRRLHRLDPANHADIVILDVFTPNSSSDSREAVPSVLSGTVDSYASEGAFALFEVYYGSYIM